MILPDFGQFRQQAQQGNLIPVWTTVPADLLTPVSAYLNLTRTGRRAAADQNYSFLFESVEGGETVARYTYMGSDPFLLVRFRLPNNSNPSGASGTGLEVVERIGSSRRMQTRTLVGDVAEVTRELLRSYRPVRSELLPPFTAGAVGYMSYDLITLREPVQLPKLSNDALKEMPDAILMFFSTLLVFDHVKHQIVLIKNVRVAEDASRAEIHASYEKAVREIRTIEKRLHAPVALEEQNQPRPASDRRSLQFRSNVSKDQFLANVCKAKEHIQAGDVFQVVLSQRLETKIDVDAFRIYRALRQVNPAPYLFFLRFGADCVLGSSPEMLVKVSGDDVEYRPIAGTRPRGQDSMQDREFERELLADEKERAEHVMLVDLGRNDLGRVCRYGSVRVSDLMFVERYSHVMHLVSSIRGKLQPGLDAWDTLWACFPAGTVTGAPKVRAMQIISDLESSRRHIYAGTVLYLDFTGSLNSCIAIRSIVVSGGTAYVQVGAGIVADSVPEREYEETLNKGKALLRAIEIAQEGRTPARDTRGLRSKARSTR